MTLCQQADSKKYLRVREKVLLKISISMLQYKIIGGFAYENSDRKSSLCSKT